jgi:uncharacterized membrane protein
MSTLSQNIPTPAAYAPPGHRSERRAHRHAGTRRAMRAIKAEHAAQRTPSEVLAERMTRVASSPTFLLLHVVWFAVWILWNSGVGGVRPFDPYPFGLLTFIVSLEGVLIATFVLIAQNRMSRQRDERDHLSLQISMLAEQELTLILKLLRRVSDRLGLPPQSEEEMRVEKLSEETNVFELVRTLREQLPEVERRSSSHGGN